MTKKFVMRLKSYSCSEIDIPRKHCVLLIREKLTQFTLAKILDRETADDMLAAIISLVADMIPECGTIIRTDNAPQFQCLNSLSDDPNSWLNKFNIKIDKKITAKVHSVCTKLLKKLLKSPFFFCLTPTT